MRDSGSAPGYERQDARVAAATAEALGDALRRLREAERLIAALVWAAPGHTITVTAHELARRGYVLERDVGPPDVDAVTWRAWEPS